MVIILASFFYELKNSNQTLIIDNRFFCMLVGYIYIDFDRTDTTI